ncbi:MAG: disulfide bond formation protein B [Maricaulaceae bacterium]
MKSIISHILTPSRFPWAALFMSGGLLGGAWFFQYVLGYAPCQMCYWQRHAHKIIIGVAIVSVVALRLEKMARFARLFCLLLALAFLGSVVMGLWHVGVEQGLLEGPKSCMSGPINIDDIGSGDLLASLNNKIKPPACSDIVWSFLGLSMAGWNALLSFIGMCLALAALRRRSAL